MALRCFARVPTKPSRNNQFHILNPDWGQPAPDELAQPHPGATPAAAEGHAAQPILRRPPAALARAPTRKTTSRRRLLAPAEVVVGDSRGRCAGGSRRATAKKAQPPRPAAALARAPARQSAWRGCAPRPPKWPCAKARRARGSALRAGVPVKGSPLYPHALGRL
jgi:hypothetical protein